MSRISTIAPVTVLGVLLAGCATQWQNPGFYGNPALEKQKLTIDNGYCKQVAAGNAPMPTMQMTAPPPSGYYVTGRSSTYGSGGMTNSNYNATITPYQNAGQSFTSGMASGAALGAMIRAKRDQEAVYEGCMAQLGWMPK